MSGDYKKNRYVYCRHVCPYSEKQIYLHEDTIFTMIDSIVNGVQYRPQFAENLKKLLQDWGIIQPEVMTTNHYLESMARGYTINFNRVMSCAITNPYISNLKPLKMWANYGIDHDLFRWGGMGKRAAMVMEILSNGSKSFTELSALGIPRRTLYRILERGNAAGL